MVIMEQERLFEWVQGYGKGDYGARKTLGFGTGLCKGSIMEQARLKYSGQGYVKGDYGAKKTWDWVQGPVNGHYGARKAFGLG